MKKGFVSVFIIVGLFLLIIMSLFVFMNHPTDPVLENPVQAEYSQYVKTCLEIIGKDAVRNVAYYGGYIEEPPYHIDHIPYYLHEEVPMVPTKEFVEKQIKTYVEDGLFFCISELEKPETKPQVDVLMTENSVILETGSLHLVREDITETISSRVVLNLRAGLLHKVSQDILGFQNESSVCLSCIYDHTDADRVYVSVDHLDGTLIYTLKDFDSLIDGRPLEYRFATAYETKTCQNPPDDPEFLRRCMQEQLSLTGYTLDVQDIPDQSASIGVPFTLQVNASGLNLEYKDYSSMFNITQDGLITFTPKEAFNQTIWLQVTDSLDNSQHVRFHMEVGQ